MQSKIACIAECQSNGSQKLIPCCVCLQAEDNSFQPILPEAEIAQIYQRILDTEIEVAGGTEAQGSGTDSKAGSSAQNLKLAAAMGLTQLMLPFRQGK